MNQYEKDNRVYLNLVTVGLTLILLALLVVGISLFIEGIQERQQEVFTSLKERNSELEVVTSEVVTCDCFNCQDHDGGEIPPITLEQIYGNRPVTLDNFPEEEIIVGDTIAMYNDGEETYVIYYHSKYGKGYYEGWNVYTVTEDAE